MHASPSSQPTLLHPTPPRPPGTGILLAVTIIYQYWEMYNKEKAQVGALAGWGCWPDGLMA